MIALHTFILQVHRAAMKNPKSTIFIYLLLFILGLISSSNIQYLTNLDDLASPDFKTFKEVQIIKNEFFDHNLLVFFLTPPQNRMPTKQELCTLKSWIQFETDHSHDILQISSTLGLRSAQWTDTHLELLPWLNLNCLNQNPETEMISKAYNQIDQSPWAPIMGSHAHRDITFLFQLHDNSKDLRYGSFDPKLVDDIENRLQKRFLEIYPDYTLTSSGNTSFLRYLKKAYDQTQLINGLLIVITSLFFWLVFRSYKAGFLFILSLLGSLIPIYGGMALTNTPVDLLTNSIPLLITVTCLEDFVFFLFLLQKHQSWRKSFRRLVFPAFLTSLTTALGFGSLVVSDLAMIRRFGAWAAIAGLLEWALLFIVFPALFKSFPKMAQISLDKTYLQKTFVSLAAWKPRVSWARALMLIVPASLVLMNRIKISDRPEGTFPTHHPSYQSTLWLEKNRGWTGQVSLLFHTTNEDLQKQIMSQISQLPIIKGVEDKFSTLSYLTRGQTESQSHLVKSLWENSSFSTRLISREGTERALLYTESSEINLLDSLRQSVETKICPRHECTLGGNLMVYSEFGLRIFKTMYESLGLSLILVSVVLYLTARYTRQPKPWHLIATSLWGPLALLFIFAALQIPLFYATSICISILIGLSGDNAIQFAFQNKSRLKDSVAELAPASVAITFGMIFMTLLFFLSDFAALQKLGYIMIAGYLLMLLGDLFILKGLLDEKRD